MTHQVEFLWFEDCPNHEVARAMLHEVIDEVAPGTTVTDIDATDPEVARTRHFPGSPTIRVDGRDVDPAFIDPGDYTPRCRLFRSTQASSASPNVSGSRTPCVEPGSWSRRRARRPSGRETSSTVYGRDVSEGDPTRGGVDFGA